MNAVANFPLQELGLVVLIGAGFVLILGMIRPKTVFAGTGCVLILLLLWPFAGILFGALPWWMKAILAMVFVLSIISWVMGRIFSAQTRGVFAGLLLHDIVLIPFRLIGLFMKRK